MKLGDLIKIRFVGGDEVGLFIEKDGPYRAFIFWEGDEYSLPLSQIEVLNA